MKSFYSLTWTTKDPVLAASTKPKCGFLIALWAEPVLDLECLFSYDDVVVGSPCATIWACLRDWLDAHWLRQCWLLGSSSVAVCVHSFLASMYHLLEEFLWSWWCGQQDRQTWRHPWSPTLPELVLRWMAWQWPLNGCWCSLHCHCSPDSQLLVPCLTGSWQSEWLGWTVVIAAALGRQSRVPLCS